MSGLLWNVNFNSVVTTLVMKTVLCSLKHLINSQFLTNNSIFVIKTVIMLFSIFMKCIQTV